MVKSSTTKKAVKDSAPLMLRRITEKPFVVTPTMMNMTVVSSPGRNPEMSDQMTDQTAPRHDQ